MTATQTQRDATEGTIRAVASTAGLGGWVPCEGRLPQDGQTVAFVVKAEIMLGYMNGRVLGGRFHAGPGGANFSVPGLAVDAW